MTVTSAQKLPDAGNDKFDGSGASNTDRFRTWMLLMLKRYPKALAKMLAGILDGTITPARIH